MEGILSCCWLLDGRKTNFKCKRLRKLRPLGEGYSQGEIPALLFCLCHGYKGDNDPEGSPFLGRRLLAAGGEDTWNWFLWNRRNGTLNKGTGDRPRK